MTTFRAVRSDRVGQLAALTSAELPKLAAGEVDVAVSLSALSRADALTATGGPSPPARPIVPGCTFVGTVVDSRYHRWHEGDAVLATGHGLGIDHPGGWAERARLPGDWLTAIPDGLTAAEAVAIGTPGLAAMLAVVAIEDQGVPPESGPVLVTGATGGLGSLAVVALAAFGYEVIAGTRRPESAGYLRSIGAHDVNTLLPGSRDSSGLEMWAAVIDVLGGLDFSALVAGTRRRGAVISAGTVTGEIAKLPLLPLARGSIAVLGINARQSGPARLADAWARWSEALNDGGMREHLARAVSIATLDEAVSASRALLAGEHRGRILIRVGQAGQLQADRLNGQMH